MRIFDYTFLKDGTIPADLLNLITNIYSLKSKDDLRKNEYTSIYSELKKIAIVQSVKGSNAIEGIITTDERIKAIVDQNSDPLNHNEKEIAGYRDALNHIHTNYKTLDFNEQTILELHRIMEYNVNPDIAGRYKDTDNVILEIKDDGTRHIRFTPIPASETQKAMEQLVLAYIDARQESSINKLILIPCVILDFLCVHPFSDGNGRMSRLLTLLLLYKLGFDVGKYISLEEQINKRKDLYYSSLERSSDEWHENKNDYFYFVGNYLLTLSYCYSELDKRFLTVNSKKINKTSRIEATIFNSLSPLSKREICEIHPDISQTTVESVLAELLKEDKIIKTGQSVATKYFWNHRK